MMVTFNVGMPGFDKKVSYAAITDLGKQRLDGGMITGPKSNILNSIRTRTDAGGATLEDILKDVQPAYPGYTKENIRELTNQLYRAQLISIR